MHYNVTELVDITEAELLNEKLHPGTVDEIFFDTRKGCFSPNNLFLALQSSNTDGHKFIHHAYHSLGTRNFFVSKNIPISDFPGANFFLCQDVISALQKLALHHRKNLRAEIIAITGSNGKTIVKEWIHQLIGVDFNIYRSPASFNSQLGVPLAVLGIPENSKYAVIEVGISKPGEMDIIRNFLDPDIGIITNIGDAHGAHFSSLRHKLFEKLKLFKNCKSIIYNKDQEIIHGALREHFKAKKRINWSLHDSNADYYFKVIAAESNSILRTGNKPYIIPFKDEFSILNAANALAVARYLGCEDFNLQRNSPLLTRLNMRLEIKSGINNCLLINDSYTSDLLALSAALNLLSQQIERPKNTLILSQLESSSLNQSERKAAIGQLINQHNIHRVIAIGIELANLNTHFARSIEFLHYRSTKNFLENLDEISFEYENILLKGARKYKLEKIFEALSSKVHQCYLHVDLESLRHNLSVYRSFLKADTKVMVMLKANAYGSGAVELARFLQYQHIDYIGVAFIDEGIELRKAGIRTPILVLNPDEAGFDQLIKYDLEPEIYSLNQLKKLKNYIGEQEFRLHIKLDTGMHRLGFQDEEISSLVSFLKDYPHLKVTSIFSHLVASEDPEEDPFTKNQIERFNLMYTQIAKGIQEKPMRHILNSSGISRFSEYQFEMVRLGLGLYGISYDKDFQKNLEIVQELKAKVSQIKIIKAGESVGYNRKFQTKKEIRSATINVGYADGLPRKAGNEQYALKIGKFEFPIIGNVCMDMCMIDLLNNRDIMEGDEVIVFGKEKSILKLAKICETIPYEIFTSISDRVFRIYTQE